MKAKLPLSSEQVVTWKQLILDGAVGVFPTETFYGLGGNALDESAVERVFTCKQRPVEKSLLILIKRDWLLVDAKDATLGRLASAIAHRLRGKHKTIYTPHVDTGDYIVVINAEKIKVTGNKGEDKIYHRHTGFPGGLYSTNFTKMQARFPGRALEKAVKGMLPKGPLGYAMIKKMKVYAGNDHQHSAQQPQLITI